jgi:hypothetical protein
MKKPVITLTRAQEMAAKEKGVAASQVKVTFRPLGRGKFRAQMQFKGTTYLIGGKDGLVAKTKIASVENSILSRLREKVDKSPSTKKISSSYGGSSRSFLSGRGFFSGYGF